MYVRYTGTRRPLPDNYLTLSPAAQRDARLNALHLQESPDDTARAWGLFHAHHMANTRKRDLASPPLHYQWIYSCAKWARNLIAAPRSFAKSTIVGKEWPLFLSLTRPNTEILIIVSTDKHATRRGQWFIQQLVGNARIKEDFGDHQTNWRAENRMWSYHEIDLRNGSKIIVTSLGSIQLGSRPDVIILDDPEPDPEKVKNWERVVQELQDFIFDVLLPMLDAGTAFAWIGTLLHRKSFLYWAHTTSDKRLTYWHRTLTAIVDKNGVPQWKEKFPHSVINRLKVELGSKFNAQCMNEPMSEDARILSWHSKRCVYSVTDHDDMLVTEPLSSTAHLTYWTHQDKSAPDFDPDWKPMHETFGSFVTGMFRFVTVDYAEGQKSYHDYSVVHVMGASPDDCVWSLDLWVGRLSTESVCEEVYRLAYKWKVRLIAIESVGMYKALFDTSRRRRAEFEAKNGWIPRLLKVQYPAHVSKPVRIASLEWRFREGRVRLPDYTTGPYRMLRQQVQNFSMDGSGLQHDDCVDTLAMQAYVLRSKAKQSGQKSEAPQREMFIQRLLSGQVFDPDTGVSYASAMSPSEIPYRAIKRAVEERGRKKGTKTAAASGTDLVLPAVFTVDQLSDALEGARERRRK